MLVVPQLHYEYFGEILFNTRLTSETKLSMYRIKCVLCPIVDWNRSICVRENEVLKHIYNTYTGRTANFAIYNILCLFEGIRIRCFREEIRHLEVLNPLSRSRPNHVQFIKRNSFTCRLYSPHSNALLFFEPRIWLAPFVWSICFLNESVEVRADSRIELRTFRSFCNASFHGVGPPYKAT